MPRHIFIDNSNIFGGAQRAAATLESGALWCAVRVYYRNLFHLIEQDGLPATRILGGSVPPGNDALWEHARGRGYNTDLLRRVEDDDGRLVEQAVDETLHLKIANVLLDHDAPGTIVIASGDGRETARGTSFPGQAERALKRGWMVEVWSWEVQLTTKYGPLARKYPGRVCIATLDPFYKAITFIKEGDYFVGGSKVSVAGRVVSALPRRTATVGG